MKEFVKIAFRKIIRMLKNIKIVSRSNPCFNTFCESGLKIIKGNNSVPRRIAICSFMKGRYTWKLQN